MIEIVVDSGCDITKELIERKNCTLSFVPLNLQLEDRVYVDDENLNVGAFIHQMESCPVGVRTASPSPKLFLDKYKNGDSVFVVTLSSALSSTYQSALMAKQMYLDEYGKKFIHVFDSLSASIGEGLVAMKIAEFARKGLSNFEIVNQVNHFISNMKTYFLIDRYDALVKSGRINPYVAKLASMLHIKPICGGVNGKLSMLDKVRGYNKAVARLIEIIKTEVPDYENRVVGISHIKCLEKAVAFKNELLKSLHVKEVIIMEASGLVASYAGRDGYVVAL